MRTLTIVFRTCRAIGIAGVLVGSIYALVQGEPPILPAVAPPALVVQVPDPSHEGHKMRADGQSCKATGKDACACTVNSCEHDSQGKVTSWHPSSSCQWWCSVNKCDCHACPAGECPDGAHQH